MSFCNELIYIKGKIALGGLFLSLVFSFSLVACKSKFEVTSNGNIAKTEETKKAKVKVKRGTFEEDIDVNIEEVDGKSEIPEGAKKRSPEIEIVIIDAETGEIVDPTKVQKNIAIAIDAEDVSDVKKLQVFVTVDPGKSSENTYIIKNKDLTIVDQGNGKYEVNFETRETNAVYVVIEDLADDELANEDPTNIILSNSSISENESSGTTVGTLSSVDANSSDTHTYILVSGTGSSDNSSFSVTGATLKSAASFDFETNASYSVRIRTSDDFGANFEKAFTISVSDVTESVNQAPSLSSIANKYATTTVAIAQVDADDGGDDLDTDGQAITYSCYYDNSDNDTVADSSLCTSLAGLTFNSASGLFNWTPATSGTYEFKITGSDGSLASAVFFTVTVSDPAVWTETKLVASDGVANDIYGASVAISGNTAVVGAYRDEAWKGGVYIYEYDPSLDSWIETKLTASDGLANDRFGISVAISGSSIAVGADGDDTSRGSAYLYRYDPSSNTWPETKLTASDQAVSDRFGISVSISGNSVLVGAIGDESSRGGAYVYLYDPSLDSWAESKLTASDGVANDEFGISVSISEHSALVGANKDESSRGAAYLFRYDPSTNAWSETKITASDGVANDSFGENLSLSANTMIIGANEVSSAAGAAYLYQFDPSSNTWTQTKLTASDGAANDNYGVGVAISGNTAIVGAYQGESFKGSAYIYQYDPSANNWAETEVFASDGAVGDFYGQSVAISGSTVVVGAIGDESARGGAYIYYKPIPAYETKLSASDGIAGDNFGNSVAISDKTALVGAYGDESQRGAAYLYQYDPSSDTWAETKLTASDGVASDRFGVNVALSASTALVGAYGDESFKGAAYLYQYDPSSDTWAETKLVASDGAASDQFGISVSVSGDAALVGASGDASARGAAYHYQYDPSLDSWAETKFTASDGIAVDNFGYSVSISGNTALVGAYGDETYRGGAYVYQYDPSLDSWAETKLVASDGVSLDNFGHSVAVAGSIAVVGAKGDESSRGSAYIYRYDPSVDTWAQTKISASDGAASFVFGYSLAISANTILVGASGSDSSKGAAYLYEFDPSLESWSETKLTAIDGAANHQFGLSVSISDNTALVGAPFSGPNIGAAYLYPTR